MASGLKVLEAMLEEDRAAVCGPRYAHQAARRAYRAGHAPSQVVLGGRKVAIRRPRARRTGTEVPLPTVRAFTDADPLNRRVVDQMLILATRQYARSLEPLGRRSPRGTSKSRSVDGGAPRPVGRGARRRSTTSTWPLLRWGARRQPLYRGRPSRHQTSAPLGRGHRECDVCQGLLTNLMSRGLRTDRSLRSSMGRRPSTPDPDVGRRATVSSS